MLFSPFRLICYTNGGFDSWNTLFIEMSFKFVCSTLQRFENKLVNLIKNFYLAGADNEDELHCIFYKTLNIFFNLFIFMYIINCLFVCLSTKLNFHFHNSRNLWNIYLRFCTVVYLSHTKMTVTSF